MGINRIGSRAEMIVSILESSCTSRRSVLVRAFTTTITECVLNLTHDLRLTHNILQYRIPTRLLYFGHYRGPKMRLYIVAMCVVPCCCLYSTLKAAASLLCQLVASITHVLAQSETQNDTQLICVPFGTCEPCPESAVRVSCPTLFCR